MIFLTLIPAALALALMFRVEASCQRDYFNSLNEELDNEVLKQTKTSD